MRLNDQATIQLRTWNIDPDEWPAIHGQPAGSEWSGDECGSTDDRCTGYHHDRSEPCGCLPTLIDDYSKTIHAGKQHFQLPSISDAFTFHERKTVGAWRHKKAQQKYTQTTN